MQDSVTSCAKFSHKFVCVKYQELVPCCASVEKQVCLALQTLVFPSAHQGTTSRAVWCLAVPEIIVSSTPFWAAKNCPWQRFFTKCVQHLGGRLPAPKFLKEEHSPYCQQDLLMNQESKTALHFCRTCNISDMSSSPGKNVKSNHYKNNIEHVGTKCFWRLLRHVSFAVFTPKNQIFRYLSSI